MTAEELLLELKDIAPPPEPPWYLLAPAEWFGLAVGLALLAGLWLHRRRRRSRWRVVAAGDALDAIRRRHAARADPSALVTELAGWLKRVALEAHPRTEVAALSGDRWLALLDRDAGEESFSRGAGRIFGTRQYRPAADFDADEIFALCARWLEAVAPRLQRSGLDRC